MPSPLDYLTENSRRTYPFKDGASLLPIGSGRVPLDNDVILDFQLVTTDKLLQRVALTRLDTFVNEYGNNISLTFTLLKFDQLTGIWTTSKITVARVASQVVAYEAITYNSTSYKLKLVAGPGMTRLLTSPYVTRTLNFQADVALGLFAAELSPSTIIPAWPTVSQITFSNVKVEPPVLIVPMSGDVTLQAGTNSQFSLSSTGTLYTVKKGIGAGLFDPCADLPTDVIKSINGINAEDYLLLTGDCYKSQPLPGQHTVRFEHTCRPKCTSEEVNATAYYENRLQDAVNKMGAYVRVILNSLKAQIAANEAAKAAKVISPFIDAQGAKTLFNTRAYHSLGVGLYDPNKKKLSVNLDAYFSGGVSDNTYFEAHPEWDDWVLYPGSPVLHEDNNAYPLPVVIPGSRDKVPLLSFRGIDCRGSAVVNFIASSPAASVDQWVKFVLSAYEGETLTGTAFKYMNLSPSARPYFNIRARRGIRKGTTNTYVHTIAVELFDVNPSWSGTTSFSAIVNSVHTVKVPQLRVNNGAITNLALSPKTVAFNGQTITWPNRAVVTFQLEATTTATVDLSLTLTVGAQQTQLSNLTFA